MPVSARFSQMARFVRLVVLGAGLVAMTGCGPPEVGSIKLPESLKRSGKPGYGPPAAKGGPTSLRPGDFRAAPAPRRGQPSRWGRR
jgi:hypothetical protein